MFEKHSISVLFSSAQQASDVGLHISRSGGRGVAADGIALGVEQELGKVPLD